MSSGTIIRADITAATANETDYVPKGQGKGILHLMDAGYGDFKLLHDIDSSCEFYITKLKANCAAVIESVKIDGKDFTNFFAGKKLSCKEFRTFREKEVVDAMVRLSDGNCYWVVRFYSKKEHQVHNFITNIFSNRITAKVICAIYKIRWQIEFLFKDLKSGSNLTGVNTGVENIVYVMLFVSLASHFLKQLAASAIAVTSGGETSLYRLRCSPRYMLTCTEVLFLKHPRYFYWRLKVYYMKESKARLIRRFKKGRRQKKTAFFYEH